MRGAGTDGLVGAMKPGNAGGAKGPDTPAVGRGQPAMGGAPVHGKPAWLEWKSRMRREPHVRFCEGGGVKSPPATRPRCSPTLLRTVLHPCSFTRA